MARFDQYAQAYQTMRMERREGILQLTFHTDGQSLQWGSLPHREFGQAFRDVGSDPENRVVILTGTGDVFSGPQATRQLRRTPSEWDTTYWEGKQLLMNLLEIEVPIISAINGPAWRHSEIPLLCDIVLAAESAVFQDSAHVRTDVVPGDGMHIVYPLLLGINRGRYFLLTGQTLDAQRAHELGLVNEMLPRDQLLPRAWELAEHLASRSPLVLRYSRALLTHHLKRQMHDLLGYGLALEGLGVAAATPNAGQPEGASWRGLRHRGDERNRRRGRRPATLHTRRLAAQRRAGEAPARWPPTHPLCRVGAGYAPALAAHLATSKDSEP